LKDIGTEAHEALTADLVLGELSGAIRTALDIDPYLVASIVSPERAPAQRGADEVKPYRAILSGVLDPDKLDYLNRDAFFCGVPYGIQDVDFILEEVFPHVESGVAISSKGIIALENILFSKYLMYKTVYWHKTVRIASAMIKKAIAMALEKGAIATRDLYGLDDEQFSARFKADVFPGFRLIEDTRHRILHKQVLRLPYIETDSRHRALDDVGARLAFEREIAADAGRILGREVTEDSIVVDVPERLSFDVAIPVVDPAQLEVEEAEGGDPVSMFRRLAAGDLPSSLRSISVSARRDPALLSALAGMDLARRFGS
jgi:HD superfamily phosphohydrolase